MNKEIRDEIVKMIAKCSAIDAYDYSVDMRVFIIHAVQIPEFKKAFNNFNEHNGVQFVITALPANLFVISQY